MQFLKLSTLQSRCAASVAASLLVFVLYFTFATSNFAYALDPGSVRQDQRNEPIVVGYEIEQPFSSDDGVPSEDAQEYEPSFPGLGRSIIGRAEAPATQTLYNNVPGVDSIAPGNEQYWIFPASALTGTRSSPTPAIPSTPILVDTSAVSGDEDAPLVRPELKARQSTGYIYITLSVCGQPSASDSDPTGPPQPLELYIAHSPDNTTPGPSYTGQQAKTQADGGFVNYTDQTSEDTYIGVYAPTNSGFSGNFTYELTASVDEPYTYQQAFQPLYFLDSDQNSTLLITTNLSVPNSSAQTWMSTGGPFSVFIVDQSDVTVPGLLNSYCGLNSTAQIRGQQDIEVGMTSVYGGLAQQQFYVTGLNQSTSYYAIMALDSQYTKSGPGNPGGGGMVWQSMTFNTKTDNNCQVIYNLSFCDTVSYAVPANPNKMNGTALRILYDKYASQAYQNFIYSLQQIPCDTTNEAMYSLAATCDDCSAAYKQWLCAVTIPRCTDFSSTQANLQVRAIAQNFTNGTVPSEAINGPDFSEANKMVWYMNSSRNTIIDSSIEPGPYKEILPCIGLCYGIVQTCPALLGFACPLAGKGQNHSYGYVTNGSLSCNIPGAIWGISHASWTKPSLLSVLIIPIATLGFIVTGPLT
jgi:calcium channel MID1